MLTIATDIADTSWLTFILEEFRRINRAEFAFRIVPRMAVSGEAPVIFYSEVYSQGICIPNRAGSGEPGRPVQWLGAELFIMAGTGTDDPRFACQFDLFWNAFVFLSRREEYLAERDGRRIKSNCRRHPRQDKSTFHYPIVNHLFGLLEELLVRHFPRLRFGAAQPPVIELSHDVDYLEKTLQLRLKGTVLNGNRLLSQWRSPGRLAKSFYQILAFLLRPAKYWCWDYWEELEKSYQRRSVFYVYVATGKKDLASWLLDPSYKVAENARLQEKLRQLLEAGFEVGLHGSVRSAGDETRLTREKNLLESLLGTEVTKIRQHWLRYEERQTPALHSKYFLYDSTIGWNDRMGFRSGCASRHRHFDHMRNIPCRHLITPMVIMDSHIYDDPGQTEALSRQAMALLKGLSRYKTSHISINWHQRVCSPDYQWQPLYEEILRLEGRGKDIDR